MAPEAPVPNIWRAKVLKSKGLYYPPLSEERMMLKLEVSIIPAIRRAKEVFIILPLWRAYDAKAGGAPYPPSKKS